MSNKFPTLPGVYLLTNKINGKIYVGKSQNIKNRMTSHKSSGKRKDCSGVISYIGRAIRKYGWENFEVSFLEVYDVIEKFVLLEIESYYIHQYNSVDKSVGYNLVEFANEAVQRDKFGSKNPFYGKRHTEELKKRFSDERKGISTERHGGLGIPLKEEHKAKISIALKGKSKPKHSLERRRQASEERKGKSVGSKNPFYDKFHSETSKNKIGKANSNKNKINQIDKNTGEIIKTWNTANEAGKIFNHSNQASKSILKVCRGGIKFNKNRNSYSKCETAYGFKWAFVDQPADLVQNSFKAAWEHLSCITAGVSNSTRLFM